MTLANAAADALSMTRHGSGSACRMTCHHLAFE